MGRTKATGKVVPVNKCWLNKQEAMAYLGVGEDFLTRLRNEALIPFYRFEGRTIWYDQESLDQFVLSNKVY